LTNVRASFIIVYTVNDMDVCMTRWVLWCCLH